MTSDRSAGQPFSLTNPLHGDKACIVCGDSFRTQRLDTAQYCSGSCRRYAHLDRREPWLPFYPIGSERQRRAYAKYR